MLKVRIYLDPSDGSKARKIAHANIVNTGLGDHEHGDYYVCFYRENKLVRRSHVVSWPRLEHGPWELLVAALGAENLLRAEGGNPVRAVLQPHQVKEALDGLPEYGEAVAAPASGYGNGEKQHHDSSRQAEPYPPLHNHLIPTHVPTAAAAIRGSK